MDFDQLPWFAIFNCTGLFCHSMGTWSRSILLLVIDCFTCIPSCTISWKKNVYFPSSWAKFPSSMAGFRPVWDGFSYVYLYFFPPNHKTSWQGACLFVIFFPGLRHMWQYPLVCHPPPCAESCKQRLLSYTHLNIYTTDDAPAKVGLPV